MDTGGDKMSEEKFWNCLEQISDDTKLGEEIDPKELPAIEALKELGIYRIYTIGYGGKSPEELVRILKENNIRTIVDVRLYPNKSWCGKFKLTKNPHTGIVGLLSEGGIKYKSITRLGNLFMEEPDWRTKFKEYLILNWDEVIEELRNLEMPICFMCCEKDPGRCHRTLIAEYMKNKFGLDIIHL